MEKIKVKGKSNKIQIYAPAYVEQITQPFQPKRPEITFGIEEQMKTIKVALKAFETTSRGFVQVVEGDTGSGKTHLLRAMTALVEKHTDSVFAVCSKGPRHSKAQLIGWQQIFVNLFEFYMPKDKKKRTQIEKVMSERADLMPHLYLLNDVLNVYFEVPSDANLEDEDADKKLSLMMIQIISGLAESNHAKILLVFDEAQYFGTKDWKIIKLVSQKILSNALQNVSILLASRPILECCHAPRFGPPNLRYQAIRNHPCTLLVCLRSWNKEVIRAYMKSYFCVKDMHPFIVEYALELTGGNPYFLQQLCDKIDVDMILERSMLKMVMSDHLTHLASAGSVIQMPVPLRVQGIIMSYIDRLNLRQIIILKLAAAQAVGEGHGVLEFSVSLLHQAHPIPKFLDFLEQDIEHLEQIGLIVPFDKSTREKHWFSFYQHLHGCTYLCDYLEFLRPNVDDDWTNCVGRFLDGKISFYNDENGSEVILELEINEESDLVIQDDVMTLTVARKSIKIRGREDYIESWSHAIHEAMKGVNFEQRWTPRASIAVVQEDPDRFAFRDGFLRHTLYETMLFKQRQLIHDEYLKLYQQQADKDPKCLFFQDCIKRHKALAEQNTNEVTEVKMNMSPRSPRHRMMSSPASPKSPMNRSESKFEPRPPEKVDFSLVQKEI